MVSRKFCALFTLWLFMAVIFAGGCGGGSSSNTTPTPTTSPDIDPDKLAAEYALDQIVIGYAQGDNPKYVTQNLTLTTKEGNVNISWSSSNPAVVSPSGIVTRPAGNDSDVTLTASAMHNGKSAEPRTFTVKVIRRRSRDNSTIKSQNITESSSGDVIVTRNESGDISDIEGQYVSFDILNADDAIDALTVLRGELGIKSPDKELETFLAASDTHGAEYSFQQVYKGVKVFGRSLMASVNASRKGDFLHSNFLASNVLDNADMKNNIIASQAESIALSSYSGNVLADTGRTERIVYSLEDYENKPVYAYVVRVYGTSEGRYVDDNVFVNADSGIIITVSSNMHGATKNESGLNELGRSVSFPVSTLDSGEVYYLRDPDLRLNITSSKIYHQASDNSNLCTPIKFSDVVYYSGNNITNDGHAISAYTNLRKTMLWWREKFERNSYDGIGHWVECIIHCNPISDNFYWINSAYWSGGRIFVYNANLAKIIGYKHTPAAAFDVFAHEFTHGVFHSITGISDKGRDMEAIDEAYADIFACIQDENWLFGEDIYEEGSGKCWRNIKTPNDENADIDRGVGNVTDDASESYYVRSLAVSHSAYLMHKDNNPSNGLTWNELAQLWYRSMHMGLNAASKFDDVRRCVVWAAMKLGFSPEKLAVIKAAFDEVGITEAKLKGTIYGTVSDISSREKVLEGVSVTAFEKRLSNGKIIPVVAGKTATTNIGRYFIQLEAGKYTLSFDKSGYISESVDVAIQENESVNVDKSLTPFDISLSGIIRDISDDSRISGATVNIRKGWGAYASDILKSSVTDGNGQYYFNLTQEGIGTYTAEIHKEGYKSASFDLAVNWGAVVQNFSLSKNDEPANEDIPIDAKYFPDDIFREYVKSFDVNGDNILSVGEASKAEKIDVHNMAISSLKGIEYFTLLKFLDCSYNNLAEIDVSRNTSLEQLHCSNNQLSEIDLSNNTALKLLACINNMLKGLDLSHNTELINLECGTDSNSYEYDTQEIITLDLRNNTALVSVWCRRAGLSSLILGDNSSLSRLDCEMNTITALNLSGCNSLEELDCAGNELRSLNVSRNKSLKTLKCSMNEITSLTLGNNSVLQSVICTFNKITVLDISGCPKLSGNVECDNTVRIIYFSSSSVSNAEILAVLTPFTPSSSGTYTFTASLDRIPPEGAQLILMSDSEDLNASFIFTESPDVVRVSADFSEGRLYSPVVAAEYDSHSQGGCMAGNLGALILFAGIILAGVKRL